MFKEIIVQIKTNWLTIYGAVVATAGLLLSLFNYFRDRAKVKIQYIPEWEVLGGHPHYKSKTTYSEIRVINKGRRPIKIEKLSARVRHDKKWIIIFDPFWFNYTNRILTEENPTASILWERDLFNPNDIYYFSVHDATGRKFRKWLHFYKYFFRRITFTI